MKNLRIDFSRLRGLTLDPRFVGRKIRDYMIEGWYVRGEEMAENRKNQLLFGYTANIIANLIGGTFFTGLLILMNADDGFIGLMSIITFASNLLQLFSPLLLERFPRRKKLLIVVRAVIMFINIAVLGITPLLPGPNALRLSICAASILVINVLNAAVAPGMTVWHIQFTPQHIRPRFFSLISMTNGLIVAGAVLISSFLVDLFKSAGLETAGLLALRGIALLLAVLDGYLLTRMKEYPYEQDANKTRIIDLFVRPFKEKRYLMTVIMACMWHFTANIPGPYYTVYLLKNLGVSYSFITLVSMLNVPVLIFLTPVWRNMLRSISWFKMLAMAMLAYLLHYVGLSFVTASSMWLYPLVLLWAYIVAIGINLAFTNIPYIDIPQKSQTVFIGFYSTMANLFALLGSVVGREFIARTETLSVNVIGTPMINKQVLMLLVAAFMLVGVGVILYMEHYKDKTASK